MRRVTTISLFDERVPTEKGSGEWHSFNAIRDDQIIGAYRVSQPRKPMIVRGPRNYLRIIYPPAHFRRLRPVH